MSYELESYGLQIIKDIPIHCTKCSHEFFLSTEEIERDMYYGNGPMGTRINYTFYAESSCPQCNQRIIFEQYASEYPEGAIENINLPNCFGGVLLQPSEIDFPFYDEEIYVSDAPIFSRKLQMEPINKNLHGKLTIHVEDGDAFLEDWLYRSGKQSTIWLNPAGKLLPILVEETGSIRFEENQAIFSEIIQTKPEVSAMRLLGKIAEAVIVRNCNDSEILNRIWLSKARRKRTTQRIANDFLAIGTGLHSTKIRYPQKYNPSDPQRDIIWVNERGDYALSANSQISRGMIAGLQIKVSGNGIKYIQKALAEQRYEIPLVYFPMNNDFDLILDRINRNGIIVTPGVDFIDVREVDEEAYFEIQDFYPLLINLFTGRLSGDAFVKEASGITPLRNGILAASLSTSQSEIKIIH